MTARDAYQPGPAAGARIHKDGDDWTLVVARELRHAPEKVWTALTDPEHLREWAPFDADRNLADVGPVSLATAGTPQVAVCAVTHAEAPRLLEFTWGGNRLRWELVRRDSGTRLTLWHHIDRRYIAWGAAGWHICLDVLARLLDGDPIGRMAGPGVAAFAGWQRLVSEYGQQFETDRGA